MIFSKGEVERLAWAGEGNVVVRLEAGREATNGKTEKEKEIAGERSREEARARKEKKASRLAGE